MVCTKHLSNSAYATPMLVVDVVDTLQAAYSN